MDSILILDTLCFCALPGTKEFDGGLKDVDIDVFAGNTAVIPCSPPASRPDAQTVFEINGDTIDETGGMGRQFLFINSLKIIKVVKRRLWRSGMRYNLNGAANVLKM